MFADSMNDFQFCGFSMVELIKLAKMTGVMDETDHAYSVQSTWWLHRLATDVPFITGVINSSTSGFVEFSLRI